MKKIVSRLMICTMLALSASGCTLTDTQKKIVTVVAVVGAIVLVVAGAKNGAFDGLGDLGLGGGSGYSGNCQYAWQTASDGSRCGARSAASRPGGWPY